MELSAVKRALLDRWQQGAGHSPCCSNRGTGAVPLLRSQERLWVIHTMFSDMAAYNVPVVLEFTGHLDVQALRRSLETVVARHEALRSVFVKSADGVRQIAKPPNRVPERFVDLSSLPESIREQESEKAARREASRRFDLESAPPLRLAIFRMGPSRTRVVLTLHHIVCDGQSMQILSMEFATLYRAHVEGSTATLPVLPASIRDCVSRERERERTRDFDADLEYWKRQLRPPIPDGRIAGGGSSNPDLKFRGATLVEPISEDLFERIQSLARWAGSTTFVTALAAFVVLLHQWTGSEQVLIACPVANRLTADSDRLIGFFANTLPLRISVQSSWTFQSLLERTREVCVEAFARQGVPFDRIIHASGIPQDLYDPFCHVLFTTRSRSEALNLPGLSWRHITVDTGATDFDAIVDLIPGPSPAVLFRYGLQAFNPDTAREFLSGYIAILNHATRHPESAVERLGMPDYKLAAAADYKAFETETFDAAAFDLNHHS